jgi:hypothetical protein
MPELNRKHSPKEKSDLGLEGLEEFFSTEEAGASTKLVQTDIATAAGETISPAHLENLLNRFAELVTLMVSQRNEANRMADQIIENQRQLIATQQILIRLMERSMELTRHITGIEERLPAVFELPRLVDNLRVRVAMLEGVEVY